MRVTFYKYAVFALLAVAIFTGCNEKKESKEATPLSDDLKDVGNEISDTFKDVGKETLAVAKDIKKSLIGDTARDKKEAKGKAVSNEIDIKNLDIASLPENPASDFDYELNENGTGITILKYIGDNPILVVPKEIEGFPVKSVYGLVSSSYYGYTVAPIKVFVAPEGVEFVGGMGGNPLEYVSLPDSLRKLPTFNNCKYLTSFTVPKNITEIAPNPGTFTGKQYFSDSGIESIVFPNGLKKIGWDAFRGAKKLKSVVFPDTVETIGPYAFDGCESLKSVTLPNREHVIIDAGAFGGVPIEELIIPDSLVRLECYNSAFGSTNLPIKTQAKLRELGFKGEF